MTGTSSQIHLFWSTTAPARTGAVLALLSDSTARKISQFAHLSAGWDYGRGGPIRSEVIEAALQWNVILKRLGAEETNAFPGTDGEIVVSGDFAADHFEIIVEDDLACVLAHDHKGRQVSHFDGLSQSEIVTKIALATRWKFSGSYIPQNLIQGASAGVALHSATQSRTNVYPWSAHSASKNQARTFATISNATTPIRVS
ncbi:hypothetical protein [Reyranella sp.]|uniref:hypothetical protein n=1 Tax=Reyranella sp. TaxID=1929291 RepID=UPI003BACF004